MNSTFFGLVSGWPRRWRALFLASISLTAVVYLPGAEVTPAETSTAVAPSYKTATLTLLPRQNPLSAPPAKPSPATPGLLENWTVVSVGESTAYQYIVWAGDTFIGVGDHGALVTSPDGVTWTKQVTKTSATLYAACSNGKLYVVVGDRGVLLTSPDLKSWTQQNSGISDRIFHVLWTGTQFVAFDTASITTSADGLVWQRHATSTSVDFHHGVWTGKEFLVTNVYGIYLSQDGLVWSALLKVPNRLMDIGTNGHSYVAVGATANFLFVSKDGHQWQESRVVAPKGLGEVTWTGTEFVAVGGSDTLLSSTDGVAWTLLHTGTGLDLSGVAAHGDTLALATGTGEILVNKKIDHPTAPEITLAPGAMGSIPQVMLTCATAGATIYYTLDGKEPTKSSRPYRTPFSPAIAVTITARAYKDTQPPGDLNSARFTPEP